MVVATTFSTLLRSIVLPLLVSSAGHAPDSRVRLKERVDLIELNHHHDDLGRHSYDQVIFYEWSPDYCRFHVIAWYLVEEGKAKRPKRDPGRQDHFVSWYDRDAKVNRVVRSELYRETWGQVDPERANKKLLEEKYRVSLVKVPQEIH